MARSDGGTEIRIEQLLGRRVRARNGQSVGRIEEFRVEQRGARLEVTHYVIGGIGLLERLGLGVRLLTGGRARGRVARHDQLELTTGGEPRLKGSIDDLEHLRG